MPDILDNDIAPAIEANGASGSQTPDWFDDDAYLRANPDVAAAIARGDFSSAFHHFSLHGRDEQRPLFNTAAEPRNRLMRTKKQAAPATSQVEFKASVEALMISASGGILLVGWVDDTAAPLEWIRLSGPGWYFTLGDTGTARLRRTDVEAAMSSSRQHCFGFVAFAYTAEAFEAGSECQVLVHLGSGQERLFDVHVRKVSDIELRDTLLSYVASAEVFGNRQVEAVRMLRGPLAATIVRHNRDTSRELVKGAYVERFGPRGGKKLGSIVVCLYGKPEYLFLQSALFAGGAGFEDYEMIYVSNSPEMAEQLLKDARTGALVYGLPQTVLLLPGNAGFGAANNVAVNHALSDRILIVNPDVFPRDADWARKHTQIVRDSPKPQTQLFGVPLYYDDGSLMHGGMYFELDSGLSVEPGAMLAQRIVRVEHYGKGTPAWSDRFTRSRPVPAVTGAFISASRPWFEQLGGFTEDFVFGHYEDADLCLKSLSAGVAPWIQDVRFWHMEGKGSTRQPVHEGGSYVNRAIFSERWEEMIDSGLQGPNPTLPLLQDPAQSPAQTVAARQAQPRVKRKGQ